MATIQANLIKRVKELKAEIEVLKTQTTFDDIYTCLWPNSGKVKISNITKTQFNDFLIRLTMYKKTAESLNLEDYWYCGTSCSAILQYIKLMDLAIKAQEEIKAKRAKCVELWQYVSPTEKAKFALEESYK